MADWYKDAGLKDDIVLSTRVRLARNISGIPFPSKMTGEEAKKVIDTVDGALSKLGIGFKKYELGNMPNSEKECLVESHYISPDMTRGTLPKAVFISDDKSVSIMVNEEDHIRMQSLYAGFESEKAADIINKIDMYLANELEYAIHPKYGYLTSCLTNVGTGLRVSYMMHLPGIVSANIADSLFDTIRKLGATVRGMYGEGSKAEGYLFQISNQITIGKSETEIYNNLNNIVNQIISKEREIRTAMHKSDPVATEDRVMREYGILKNARLMSTGEMLKLVSNGRFGISLGITDIKPSVLSQIIIETSPAHISGGKEMSAKMRDEKRAEYIRKKLTSSVEEK